MTDFQLYTDYNSSSLDEKSMSPIGHRRSVHRHQGKWALESAVTVESSLITGQCKAEPKAPVSPDTTANPASTRKNTHPHPHPLIRITLCDFITIALNADHGTAPTSSGFEFQTTSEFLQFQEKCDASDGQGTDYKFHTNYPRTPWPGAVVDEVEQCRKGFYNFGRQQIQKSSNTKERESRVRDKSFRGSTGRDRKMRIRSLRGSSPVFPPTGLSPPRESSASGTNMYLHSPPRSTFSPSRGDHTPSQRGDSGDEEASPKFLSRSTFEPTRSFTMRSMESESGALGDSSTGMESGMGMGMGMGMEQGTGTGSGTGTAVSSTPSMSPSASSTHSPLRNPSSMLSVSLPKSANESLGHAPSDSFAPHNHPSFESYCISNPYTASTSISTSISTSASGSPVRNPKTSLASFSFLSMGACSPTDKYEANTHTSGHSYKNYSNAQLNSSTSTSLKSSLTKGIDAGTSIFAANPSPSIFSPGFYRKSDDQKFHTVNQVAGNLVDCVSGCLKKMDCSLKKVFSVLDDSQTIRNFQLHNPEDIISGEDSSSKEGPENEKLLEVVAALLDRVALQVEVRNAPINQLGHSNQSEFLLKGRGTEGSGEVQGQGQGQGPPKLGKTRMLCSSPYIDLLQFYFKSFDVDDDDYLTVNDFNEFIEETVNLTDKYEDSDESSDGGDCEVEDEVAVRGQKGSNCSEVYRNRSSANETSYVDAEEEDGGEEKSSRLEVLDCGSSSNRNRNSSDFTPCLTPPITTTPVTAISTASNAAAATTAIGSVSSPFNIPYPDVGTKQSPLKDTMSQYLDNLVMLVCATVDCNATQADDILRLLQQFKWDADTLVLSLIASPHGEDLSSSLSAAHTLPHLLSPSNCLSLSQRNFRCLSSVMRRLKLRDASLGTKSKVHWTPSKCVCGSIMRPSDNFSLTQCGHWRCRKCWVGVINSSLHGTETETEGGGLWRCPHVDHAGRRCEALLGGEFASHLLCSSHASVRRSYYLSELRKCASRLSARILGASKGALNTSITVCPSLASVTVMSWWTAVTHSNRRPSAGEASMSPSRTMSIGSHEDASQKDNTGAETPSSVMKTMVVCKRLMEAQCCAETRCAEVSLAAEHALDGPSFTRLHALSDQYALVASASSTLSQVHIILSFEAEGSEDVNIGKGGRRDLENSQRSIVRECLGDTCSLFQMLEAMEKLITSFSQAVNKLSTLRSLDPQFQGPQTRALTSQIRIMTAALRRLLWNLSNRVSSTHSYVKYH